MTDKLKVGLQLMNNITKIKISTSPHDVFEAFADPDKIGNFWFSSSSERWQQGKTITLKYDEYAAQGDIKVLEIDANERIVFEWGGDEEPHVVTMTLRALSEWSTIVEVTEEGFRESDGELIRKLLDSKEGWTYMLTCLKAYLEFDVRQLRAALIK